MGGTLFPELPAVLAKTTFEWTVGILSLFWKLVVVPHPWFCATVGLATFDMWRWPAGGLESRKWVLPLPLTVGRYPVARTDLGLDVGPATPDDG